MSGAASRTKGHNFERHIAKLFREFYPEARRGYQSRGGGAEQADVEGTPFHVECKVGKQTNIKAAVRQALTDTDGRPIVVVTKDDRSDTLVTMLWDDWKALLNGR